MDWLPDLTQSDKPRYLAIADRIAADIAAGTLAAGDRLPPQRRLAEALAVDFTTVARGYVEAQRRGLVESRIGQGTFVKVAPARPAAPRAASPELVDLSMTLPPEPDDPALIARLQQGMVEVSERLVSLLRYQPLGGAPADKAAAGVWLGRRGLAPAPEQLFVVPGANAALLAILTSLAKPGDAVLCEALTYPGIRSICAQLGLSLAGLAMDRDGLDPEAFAEACTRLKPKALYLNPILQNPTTITMPEPRRAEVVAIARRHGVAIIEDDAYGFVPVAAPTPFAALAPELSWHIAGLSKCLGAGLRLAYVVVPDLRSGWPFAAGLRASCIMASPLTAALATRWIEDGSANALLDFLRAETTARQRLAAEILPAGSYRVDPLSFNLWLEVPPPWTRSAFVGQMQATGIGIVASDAFATKGPAPEAARICLGGPIGRKALGDVLAFMAHALEQAPEVNARAL
ncbi:MULTISPECIES: PLP-dependent aminotransferase family protein [unclassified Bosea (in: a-proteobacteria)]|uniref:aminotransferase-like domain-containing protein n=1 Tax=unclassified Bosea (in: a-proteobacteria) TaxID=2653178 RepID=UPI000F750ACA|nr:MULTISPECIES: PLP-dependent aminotransferase family protein [unclassified Bosea (in: a-proteobacteria)]AZO80870.1 GntR family transcriptional regulator [Bosea sp. Tri-49]RXT25836.1 GntR family transcriptional regulator [Bosea sp. Tri-39]RXT31078.1 GntR family transcriptional regulator [Bosea sp. Tri-54]